MGEQAAASARLLLGLLRGEAAAPVILPTRLVTRESS